MRRYLTLLVVFALSLRALVPVGFMPGQASDGNGSLTLVICTSNGLLRLDPSDDLPGAPHEPVQADNSTCAFGVLSSDVPLPAPEFVALPAETHSQDVGLLPHDAVVGSLMRRPNLARGPPSDLT